MIGIIACIVAAVKGHKTFAWVTGVWSLVALLLLATGVTTYAFSPGIVFLIIAISMKKIPNEAKGSGSAAADAKPAEPAAAPEAVPAAEPTAPAIPEQSKVYVCTNCGGRCKGWYQVCPSCGSIDQMVAADSALPVSDSELVVCAHCGAQIKAQAKFCPYCGSGTGK